MPNPSVRNALREELRTLAREEGAAWLRPILTAAGVDRIGALDTQVLRYILAREAGA